MKRPGAIGFVALMLVLSILYAWFRLSSELGNWENPTTIITVETAKHVVTPSMAEVSRAMVFRQAPAFTLKATDGAEYSLGKLIGCTTRSVGFRLPGPSEITSPCGLSLPPLPEVVQGLVFAQIVGAKLQDCLGPSLGPELLCSLHPPIEELDRRFHVAAR